MGTFELDPQRISEDLVHALKHQGAEVYKVVGGDKGLEFFFQTGKIVAIPFAMIYPLSQVEREAYEIGIQGFADWIFAQWFDAQRNAESMKTLQAREQDAVASIEASVLELMFKQS